jgi:signal transduction histidine kinase/CheY-like chemotaxis protein
MPFRMEVFTPENKTNFFKKIANQYKSETNSEVFPVIIVSLFVVVLFGVDVFFAIKNKIPIEPIVIPITIVVNILLLFGIFTGKTSNKFIPIVCFLFLASIGSLILINGLSTGIYFYYIPVLIVYIIFGSDLRHKIKFRLFFFNVLLFLGVIVFSFLYDKTSAINFILNSLFIYRINAAIIFSAILLRYLMPTYINKENFIARKNYAEALFQTNLDAFIIFDNTNKEIIDYNKKASLLLELPMELRLNGLYISQLMMRYLTSDNVHMDVLMNNIPQNWQGEANFKTHNKREFVGYISTSTYIKDAKEFQILSIRDITKMKEPEKELSGYKASLENSTQVKTRFLSSMSHELRTPLNGIIGTSNLILEDETISENAREQLKLQLYSSEHMLSIINDILDFSKIDSGKMEFNRQTFNLLDVLQKIVKAFENQFKNNNLDFEFVSDEDLVGIHVVSDQVKLSQVLNNLLSNALKFTLQGKVILQVLVSAETNESVSVLFKIIDTGIGIKEEKQTIIFDGFSQVHADDLKRKFGGTGLGLTISKKLVELFGGKLTVESEFGKGSCFSFGITFKKQTEIQKPVVSSDMPFAQIDIRGVRVLIVEDNEINVTILRGFLLKWGIRVKEASNGIHALELLKYHTFDLILMDLEMPEMNGYTAANIIRETDKTIPIIAFTATLLEDMNTLISEGGFNDYMLKPFRPAELKKKIELYSPHRKIDYSS